MGKTQKWDFPTKTFPYKISKRLNIMSVPRKYIIDTGEGMPAYTPRGIRKSALRSHLSDRINDAAYPYLRYFLLTKRMYKNRFSAERLERIDKYIEAANATCYSKLANCVIGKDAKKGKDQQRRKTGPWTESDWKKHTEYLRHISRPKKDFRPPPTKRGKGKPIEQLLPRINEICFLPEFKFYRRLSQESSYRNPIKVAPNALKYVITERTAKLAVPKIYPDPNAAGFD